MRLRVCEMEHLENTAAAKIMQENGIISTGIFMVRPDFEEKDFCSVQLH